MALYLPLLPLEALPLRQPPSAVVHRGRVLACDAPAAETGVAWGQKLSTALGLCPGLGVFERDPRREADALQDLACWAGRFTPTISLKPSFLLLEIGGCLRLFGGVEAIVGAALDGCAGQGWTAGWSVAPTPLGACWLAQAGGGIILTTTDAMRLALAALPCAVTGWPENVLKRLDSFGLKSLGDLRALPSASLRQRLGSVPVDDLSRAWGDIPDVQQPFVFPEKFSTRIELPSRVEHAEGLIFAGQRLFAALAGWLQARQLWLRHCTLALEHDDAPHSVLALRFAEPVADEARFVRLLRERLGCLQLVAPVEGLVLTADEVVKRQGDSAGLFDTKLAGEGALACIERLQARLGENAVQRLAGLADYRPECATQIQPASGDFGAISRSTAKMSAKRPLWLLPVPQPLAERAGGPYWHGPLQLLSRAERLESGWWDEGEHGARGDVRRDYFVAHNPHGQWAWIFRDAEGWFLHGLFA